MTVVLLKIAAASHEDILMRLQAIGPEYIRDYTTFSREVGRIIVLGEVGLVREDAVDPWREEVKRS